MAEVVYEFIQLARRVEPCRSFLPPRFGTLLHSITSFLPLSHGDPSRADDEGAFLHGFLISYHEGYHVSPERPSLGSQTTKAHPDGIWYSIGIRKRMKGWRKMEWSVLGEFSLVVLSRLSWACFGWLRVRA